MWSWHFAQPTVIPMNAVETVSTALIASSWELRQIGIHLGDNYQVVRELGQSRATGS